MPQKVVFRVVHLRLILAVCLLMPIFVMAQDQVLFNRMDHSATGVHFRNDLHEPDSTDVSYHVSYEGGGVAIGDLNNDGLPDIVFTSGQKGPALYINKGYLKFENMTVKAGLSAHDGFFKGVNIADVNGDGWNDVFVVKEQGDQRKLLFINNHDGTFTESAAKYGINDVGTSIQSLFFDFNNDGYLDLLLLNTLPSGYSKECPLSDYHDLENGFDVMHFLGTKGHSCWGPRLYLNHGDHFEDITVTAGMEKQMSYVQSATACDFDFDGYADVFVGSTFISPDMLYHNDSGKNFQNVAPYYFQHSSFATKGSDYGDINNDGIPDLLAVDIMPSTHQRSKTNLIPFSREYYQMLNDKVKPAQYFGNSLFLGTLSPPFVEAANAADISRTDWSGSSLIQDFDNDGMNDIFITAGTKRDEASLDLLNDFSNGKNPKYGMLPGKHFQDLPHSDMHNFMFRNGGNVSFKDVTRDWGLYELLIANGAAYADLDGDGDLDLVVNNMDTFASIYENLSNRIGSNHYIRFRLMGSNHNTAGLGAFVKIFFQGNERVEYLGNAHGFFSTTEPIAHFGLDKSKLVDSVEVYWPGGDYQIFRNYKADSLYSLHQSSGIRKIYHPTVVAQNLLEERLTDNERLPDLELPDSDTNKYTLLPFKPDVKGALIAVGDLNHDGLEDYYTSASTSASNYLFIQHENGSFSVMDGPWSNNSESKDHACVIADFNKDGWKDLLIAKSNTDGKGDSLKLYLNDREGHFIDASDRIPKRNMFISSMDVNDFNGDGYTDILIGGSASTGNYSRSVSSVLLVNHKGKLANETDTRAPDLKNIGNVRSVLWTDFDNDGKQDMVLVGEWMAITFLHNEKGHFVRVKGNATLDSVFGMWTNIVQADFDHDGLPDYVVCNYGTNGYLKATRDEPVSLYYGDFDDDGIFEPLTFQYLQHKEGILYDKNTYCKRMPTFKSKFPTYKSFADAKINDFISDEKMRTAKKFIINEMQTSYIQNLGEGKFKMVPLPVECQLSIMYSALPADVNGDGNIDIVMVGNGDVNPGQYAPMNGSQGVVLINDGKGNFRALKPEESGFRNEGYGRCLKLIDKMNKVKLLLVANNNGRLKFFNLPQLKLK